jgi:hypothetical protein
VLSLDQPMSAFSLMRGRLCCPEALSLPPLTPLPLCVCQPRLSVVRGPLYEEVRQELSPWASQTFRVYTEGADADLQYTVSNRGKVECRTWCAETESDSWVACCRFVTCCAIMCSCRARGVCRP